MKTETEMDRELREELLQLRSQHRAIDEKILELESIGALDQLTIKRLKKQKLQLKDRINSIEIRMTPDIIA
ncbi:MAG: YdcH family protein [Hyphomicrobiaceae bacterium]